MKYRSYHKYWVFNIFTQIWSGAKDLLGICDWGAGLAVTGRLCYIEQNFYRILLNRKQYTPSYFQMFFLIAFLEQAFIRNIIQ